MSSALTENGSTRKWRQHRVRILIRDRYTCQWCGRTLSDLGPRERMTVGHIVARRHGGGDEDWNLAAQCSECQRQERPVPSRAAMHKSDGGSAYSEPMRANRLPVHNAPGRPVSVYGRRATPTAGTADVGQPAPAGGTVGAGARGTSVFKQGAHRDMRLFALSTHETGNMHSTTRRLHTRAVVSADYTKPKDGDGAA